MGDGSGAGLPEPGDVWMEGRDLSGVPPQRPDWNCWRGLEGDCRHAKAALRPMTLPRQPLLPNPPSQVPRSYLKPATAGHRALEALRGRQWQVKERWQAHEP